MKKGSSVHVPKINMKAPVKLGGGPVRGSNENKAKAPAPNKPVKKGTNP